MDVDLSDMEDDYEEVSFQDIFGEALAKGSTTIAIQQEMVAKVKKGIINAKQSIRRRANRHKLTWDRVTLEFEEKQDEEIVGIVHLTVRATKKAVIKIFKIPFDPRAELTDE
jgi:hypothetical protein